MGQAHHQCATLWILHAFTHFWTFLHICAHTCKFVLTFPFGPSTPPVCHTFNFARFYTLLYIFAHLCPHLYICAHIDASVLKFPFGPNTPPVCHTFNFAGFAREKKVVRTEGFLSDIFLLICIKEIYISFDMYQRDNNGRNVFISFSLSHLIINNVWDISSQRDNNCCILAQFPFFFVNFLFQFSLSIFFYKFVWVYPLNFLFQSSFPIFLFKFLFHFLFCFLFHQSFYNWCCNCVTE